MKVYSSEEIKKATDDVKKSGHDSFMFRDPGCEKRQTQPYDDHQTSVIVTSRHASPELTDTSPNLYTSVIAAPRQQNTSANYISSQTVSMIRSTNDNFKGTFTKWDPNTQPNTFPWAALVPIRGSFCCPRNTD